VSDQPRQESPLAARRLRSAGHSSPRAAGVTLCERALLGHINLRGKLDSAVFRDTVEHVLGLALPLQPNTFGANDVARACWLGPDEWLIVCDGAEERARADDLRRALAGQFAAVTEVGSGQTVIGIAGPRARDVLAKGCPLDVHPRVFGPGRCAQSYLARAGIMIMRTGDPAFDLVVRRSYADYVWRWLLDAAKHDGCAVIEAPAGCRLMRRR
jgi:sarcosine oxidase, subunit gamma